MIAEAVRPTIYPVISQVGYPLSGDVDDCAVIATYWAARDAGYTGSLPTVPAFRKAAGEPDVPGPNGLDNYQVWMGVQGTVLASLHPMLWNVGWSLFAFTVKDGASGSLAVLSSKLPPNLRFGFVGPHRVGVAWDGSHLVVANPLAPSGSAPLPCDELTLRQAAYAVSGGYALAVTFPPQEIPDMLPVTDPIPKTVDVAVGKLLYDLNGHVLDTNHLTRNDAYSPFGTGAFRAVVIGLTAGPTLLLVKRGDVTGVKAWPGDTKHRVTVTVDDGRPPITMEV